MPFNGSGIYTAPSPENPVTAGNVILASDWNTTIADIVAGLCISFTRDGQSTATANLPMGGFKFTGLGAGVAPGQSVRFDEISNLTNDAQTKAAIVPNTAPAAGEILVGNADGTAYAKAAISGDLTLASTGAATIAAKAVSLAKMADMATASVIYRKTDGSGAPEVQTLSTLKTDLSVANLAGSAAQDFSTKVLTPAGLIDASGAAAGQIKFPASQNASADANTLDDYEEGTWTPSVGGSATYNTQTGTYTKIGNLVHVHGRLYINAIGTGSTTSISGLPFTVGGSVPVPGSVGYFQTILSSVYSLGCQAINGGNSITFLGITATGTNPTDSFAIFQNSTFINFAVTYQV